MKERMTKLVKDEALSLGADLVGIAPVERWENAPPMLCPKAHLPEASSVIVMGIHHPDASVEWGGLPNSNYAGPFQIGMIPKLDTMSRRLARFMETFGEKAVPYPCTGFWRHRPYKEIKTTNTASFSHRHAAVAAGLGEFGWNNLFLSAKYGPRQRLISVITSARLEPDPLYSGTALCDECMMCAKHCPGDNFSAQLLLEPGTDQVRIENAIYEYAKLNRWRCLWGEQFAFDMDKLASSDPKREEDLYKAVEEGMPRLGGEFGCCLRYCMSKPVRYWDRRYTSAPRRRKEDPAVCTEALVKKIEEFAIRLGADKLEIRPLSEFSESEMQLSEGYPIEKMKRHFSWVISFGRTMPSFPTGNSLLEDCEHYLKAAAKVRLSIAAYDISACLDNLGFEAMQDWMSLAEAAFAREEWNGGDEAGKTATQYVFDANEERPLSREIRYKAALCGNHGVQREQQSMTAGAQNQTSARDSRPAAVSCAVICNAPLRRMRGFYAPAGQEPAVENLQSLACLKTTDRIGIVPVDKINDIPGIINVKKALPEARSLIVLLTGIPKYIAGLANRQKAECASSYSYLQYQTLRELLWAAHDLSDWLEAKGCRSLPMADMSLFSFRTAAPYWEFSWVKLGHPDPRANAPLASAAGLGEIGKSGLLLTPDFGPYHKFVFVATTADLPSTPDYTGPTLCHGCGRCARACPVSALETERVCKINSGGRDYECYQRHEDRCQWARSLGMVGEEGPETIGWRKPALPVPEKITEQSAMEALEKKDPLQVHGYLYPCQIETLVEPCARMCPTGE